MKMRLRLCSVLLGIVAVILLAAAFHAPQKSQRHATPRMQLMGTAASDYLAKTSDGQSLMQALTAARFGLQWQEHVPGENKAGDGYLAMSHEQNLNAWFDNDGVTVRPTLPEAKRDEEWSVALRLRAFGYGKDVQPVPPIVSRQVKNNRIEYQRSSNQQSAINNQQLVEWYENRAEGIEQGLTLNERPERSGGIAAHEPLRVSLAVSGDLRAQSKNEGRIELVDARGKGALSYSKLMAQDADGKKLSARMEASADGREIALLVEDAGARYPIVIDPIMAALEQKLRSDLPQADARFGFAVAIDGNLAVVGAWREDVGSDADVGAVYVFVRTGAYPNSSWALDKRFGPSSIGGQQCGWSVAISGNRIAFGCPGENGDKGTAIYFQRNGPGNYSGASLIPQTVRTGDRFGTSVGISGNNAAVGAPGQDIDASLQNTGAVHFFAINSDGTVSSNGYGQGQNANDQAGTAVAVAGDIVAVGAPGVGAGSVYIWGKNSIGGIQITGGLQPSDGMAGDQFGQSVAISGTTVVVGAPLNSNAKGTNAGAAYVFIGGQDGFNWSQQQKLIASDGNTNNYFSASAVAIQDNTILVGSYAWDGGTPPFIFSNDDRGSAYVFTRSGTVWTQQTEILAGDGERGDNFGISVGLSGDSAIIGSRHATAVGTAAAGAAYVYRLSCVPPSSSKALETGLSGGSACPGDKVFITASTSNPTGASLSFQWRHNGTNIPGATAGTYSINSATASDAGSYDVIVSNACGADISQPFTLVVFTFSLNPTSQNFGVSGSNGIANVTATGSCTWTAVSNATFITVTSGSSGAGNGTVGFTVGPNSDPGQRTGTMTIAGKTFTVSQDGTNCSYSISPASQTLSASASTNTVNVTASAGCAWTATSNDSFLSINSGASGSGNGTVTYTIAANSITSPRTGTLTIAGQTFTVTQSAAPGLVANVSTRLLVGTGDNALFEGFTVQGPAGSTKKIIVRAIGPSLIPFGIADALANPTLEIHDASSATVATNNDWKITQVGGLITGDQSVEISASGLAPSNDLESAIIANLMPGSYTAVVRGFGDSTGTGVVDAYDLSTTSAARLANIATRGLIQPGDKLMIAGFIVQNGSVRAVISAIGPSLTSFGISNALPDTTLQVKDQNGTIVIQNDDWQSDQKQELENTGLQPSDPREAAVVVTLPPGQYTAQVRGKPETTGIGVVQAYFLQ